MFSVEDARAGYPRFSALLAAHNALHIFRSFRALRTRLLLVKQGRLSSLAKQLDRIDAAEERGLNLSSIRRDGNAARKGLLVDIDDALRDYDALLERNHRVLELNPATPRNVSSVQNWVKGNPCTARNEVAFLDHPDDLLGVISPQDETLWVFEAQLQRALARLWTGFRRRSMFNVSRDPAVYISSRSPLRTVARAIIRSGTVLLLLPMVRLGVVAMAASPFVAMLCWVIRARPVEMFVAGAMYTTVLVVFIFGSASQFVFVDNAHCGNSKEAGTPMLIAFVRRIVASIKAQYAEMVPSAGSS
ncbi:hypothetical protein K458DRAFT_476388 [Lentithecium fluviatile CBS 122367]|uniref:DUF6594 domain-containing protein n=1 Tax=Lentithecium fluviatile CBS 122367 TaxID=1168545 RepID=A0A6G1J7I1_9PLEO|nr:hypothetical protein K458DRAFT_476388 [Lentithecium fluviatile CBS 122367]